MSSTVSIGIRHDCQRLLHRFVETESVRYEQFSQIWREMNFSLLQCGLRDKVDQKVFLEETFQVVVAFFLPPYGFQVRVGALYLLYGFYTTQTHVPKIKIRITLQQWKNVLAFEEEVNKQKHLDTQYIFRKLRAERAFLFVALPAKTIPKRTEKMTGEDDDKDSSLEQPSVLSEIFEGDPLERLDNLHTEYQRMKCIISGSDEPNRSLSMVKEPLAQEMSSIINEYEEWRKKKREARYANKNKNLMKDTEDSQTDEDWTEMSPSMSRRRRIDEIKKKSYSGVAKASRSRRHRQASQVLRKKESAKKGRRRRGRRSGESTASTECEENHHRDLESIDELGENEYSEQTADNHFEKIAAGLVEDRKESMPLLVMDEVEEQNDSEQKDINKAGRKTPKKRKSPSKTKTGKGKAKGKSSPAKKTKKTNPILDSPSEECETNDVVSNTIHENTATKTIRGKRRKGKQTKDVGNRKRRKTK